jgi:putrescine aminotransferase
MAELPFYNSFFQCAHPPAIRLAELLAEVTPAHMQHVFFTSSGSEANDTVLRMVRQYWAAVGRPNRTVVISRENAYHGSTMGGASLGGMAYMHKQGGLPIPGIEHIPQPYYFEHQGNLSAAEFGIERARELERRIETVGADNVAAFIGEPIQGAGGVKIPPASYWPEIQRICRKYDVLLMLDEVITGYGRTGEWFAAQSMGIEADTITTAKALTSGYQPLSALLVGDRIAATVIEKGGEFFHGYTYSGHPVACAVALKNLEIIEREGMIERVRNDTGPYFAAQLQERIAPHGLVGEVRSFGFLGAIEIVKNKRTRERFVEPGSAAIVVRDHAIANGMMLRATGDTMIMSPPLIWTRATIDMACDRILKALDLAESELRGQS